MGMIHLLILARQNAGVDRAFREHARARSQERYRRSATERMRGVTVRASGRTSGKSMWQILQAAMQGWSRHRVASLGAALALVRHRCSTLNAATPRRIELISVDVDHGTPFALDDQERGNLAEASLSFVTRWTRHQ